MDLTWLAVFREVAERGSLSAAALALGYTQPAVSRQISALEQATGGHLFDRLPRGMRLTDEGRCLLGHAEAVLDRMHAAQQDLAELRGLGAGRLRIGAFDSADAALVPRALAALRAAHPGVCLSVLEGASEALLARLQSGDIDVAVISAYAHQALDAGRLVLHHLLDDPLMVALPQGHRLAGPGRAALRLADLAGESWIEGFPGSAQALTDACLRAGFRPQIDFPVREWPAKQGFVSAGLGLALVPFLAASAVRPGIVLRPLHPGDAPVRGIYAATWRAIAAPPPVTAFLDCLDDAVRELRDDYSVTLLR
ncbi:MAG TPA: LysR family transcriptional regulator [Streptosporangiaceae bacterium]|nr:LysR family transcriptional regulator [Streptosporangiaceae bacterium]